MGNVDITKLSYAELKKLQDELNERIEGKREEELKVLVDGYAKKAQGQGFSVEEVVEALQPYLSQTPAAPAPKGKTGRTIAAKYRDPANPSDTWSGQGQPAKWIKAYEAAGRNREEFRV